MLTDDDIDKKTSNDVKLTKKSLTIESLFWGSRDIQQTNTQHNDIDSYSQHRGLLCAGSHSLMLC
jgi:hypothetical protein